MQELSQGTPAAACLMGFYSSLPPPIIPSPPRFAARYSYFLRFFRLFTTLFSPPLYHDGNIHHNLRYKGEYNEKTRLLALITRTAAIRL